MLSKAHCGTRSTTGCLERNPPARVPTCKPQSSERAASAGRALAFDVADEVGIGGLLQGAEDAAVGAAGEDEDGDLLDDARVGELADDLVDAPAHGHEQDGARAEGAGEPR